MKDDLWSMSQRSHWLESVRADIRVIWHDQAAHEINTRYLNPHQADDSQMLQSLGKQEEVLDQAQARLSVAQELAVEASKLAQKVMQLLLEVGDEVSVSFSHYDAYGHYNIDAQSKFPLIREQIRLANGACAGICKSDGSLDVHNGMDIFGNERRKPVHSEYSGKIYPISNSNYPSGVKFTDAGYPNFSPYAKIQVKIAMTGDRDIDFKRANQVAGYKRTPIGYTWHHHEDRVTMQLLPRDLHKDVRHSGGVSLIKEFGPLI